MVAAVVAVVLVLAVGTKLVTNWVDRDAMTPAEQAAVQEKFDQKRLASESSAAAAAKAEITAVVNRPTDRPLRVLFAGDSLTVGWGATTREQSFRETVGRSISADGPMKETVAHGLTEGRYTVGNLGGFGTKQDLIVVEIGTNDLGHLKPEVFAKKYAAMLGKMKKVSPDAALLCLGVWHANGNGVLFPDEKDFDQAIRTDCDSAAGHYVDVTRLINDTNIGPKSRKTWDGSPDDFHPNDLGHAALAKAILAQLDIVG